MCSLVFLWRKVDTFSSQRVSDPMSYRGRSCVFTYFGAEHRAPVYVKTMYVKTHQTVHFKYVHLLHVSYTSFFFFFSVLRQSYWAGLFWIREIVPLEGKASVKVFGLSLCSGQGLCPVISVAC